MKNLGKVFKQFVRDDRGLETVEYAIITGLIVAGTITVIGLIGAWVHGTFSGLESELPDPVTGG